MESADSNLEKLRKSFIINREEYQQEKLPQMVERVLKYCKVDSEGGVHIEEFSLTMRDKIVISLIARFLANKLEPSLNSEIGGEELSVILDIDKAVAFARLKELADTKMIKRRDKGSYEVVPYYMETLLNEIDSKYSSAKPGTVPEEKVAKKIKRTNNSKNYKSTNQGIDKSFLNEVSNIDKSNYVYLYNLSSVNLKILAVLDLARKELNSEWLSSPQILKIFSEKFRIKAAWSTVSGTLKKLDTKAFVEFSFKIRSFHGKRIQNNETWRGLLKQQIAEKQRKTKMKRPSKIQFADEKVQKAFNELSRDALEKGLHRWLVRAFRDIEENSFCGIQIPKRLIPKEYVKKYNIHNLWKYNLPNAWRLLYSIEADGVIVVSIVLEWMDHKSYERKFRY